MMYQSKCLYCNTEFEYPTPRKFCPDTDCRELYSKQRDTKTLLCPHCGHVLETKKDKKLCPACNRYYAIKKKNLPVGKDLSCFRCGNSWISRIENPKYCPLCKSPYWNKPKKEYIKGEDREGFIWIEIPEDKVKSVEKILLGTIPSPAKVEVSLPMLPEKDKLGEAEIEEGEEELVPLSIEEAIKALEEL